MDLRSVVVDWWRRTLLTRPRIRRARYYDSVSDLPTSIPRNEIAVVRSGEIMKWAAFECPCGHNHRILINLDPQRRVSWRITGDPPTLSPSIDSRGTRRCHFLLNSGRVTWVRDRLP